MPYSGDPSTGVIDAVRFWLRDTGTSPLLSDAEIHYLMDYTAAYSGGDPLLIAAVACTSIMAKYAGKATISADGVSISQSEFQQRYTDLATSLREQYSRLNASTGGPYAGGVDACVPPAFGVVPPLFTIGGHDNPRGSSQLTDTETDAEFYGWDQAGIG